MELKRLNQLEATFYEEDFDQNDKKLKKEIIEDISKFNVTVWYERKDIVIRNSPKHNGFITINCPTIHTFNFPEGSETHYVRRGPGIDIHFNYNNKSYKIRQSLSDSKDYCLHPA